MSSNLLGQETSPYLLLHKDNPVHWRPWGPEALAEAEESGKPILLSIGYTACHWCHVMNHESFANPEIAALMNDKFITVKVDREERPDIDQFYQTAANNMGINGGWPLTMFLTPKGEPFFAGTYYPPEDRFGQPSLPKVLDEVSRIYAEQPEPVANTTAGVNQKLTTLWNRDTRADLPGSILDDTALSIGQRFDIFHGGVIGTMKFPVPPLVELLWRAYLRTGAFQFQQLAQTTLDGLSRGGIYDHVGGGWSRYSVDPHWIVPHFEKMLYDNALLVELYTLVWQGTRVPAYRDRIEDTIAWMLREMRVEDAFASSLDADSEGEEGKYYVWSEAEIDATLMGTFVQRFKDVYSVTRQGNFNGKNVLHRLGAVPHPLPEADEVLLKKQRALLLAARQNRKPPMRDDKILADWNGMAIASLAFAGAVFKRPDWVDAAMKAFAFIEKALGEGDRLFHSWRAGKRGASGFADDYAQMARGALALWEVTGDTHYLERAQAWTRTMDEHFWDMGTGGYYYAADDAEVLPVRSRVVFDQSTPSANGVMLIVLNKLYLATMDSLYRDRANALVQAFAGEVGRTGISMGTYLNGLENVMTGLHIVIVGPVNSPKTHDLVNAVLGRSLPTRQLMVVSPTQRLPEGHPAQGKIMEGGQPTAYVCQRTSCSAPITNPVALSQILQLPPQAPQGQA
ncbi:MAG TPA: thioredoxin domain-containing protein [Rhizomicrobium sp.]|jgi:hypothetical protein|nr:thioredoxin domain-containing protein [Rhizomicrobium sp.]